MVIRCCKCGKIVKMAIVQQIMAEEIGYSPTCSECFEKQYMNELQDGITMEEREREQQYERIKEENILYSRKKQELFQS